MESDTSENKKISLENMSKEEIIKKYNNLLLIAKKAKQSKNESLEELRKIKDKEYELLSEIKTLKEALTHFNKKGKVEEFDNKIKQNEKEIMELKSSLHKMEDKYALKIIECTKLEEALHKLNNKLSENLEKFEYFREGHSRLEVENQMILEKLFYYENEAKNTDPKRQPDLILYDVKKKKELSQSICDELKSELKKVKEEKELFIKKLEEQKLEYINAIASVEKMLENERRDWNQEKNKLVLSLHNQKLELDNLVKYNQGKSKTLMIMRELEEKIEKQNIIASEQKQIFEIIKNLKKELFNDAENMEKGEEFALKKEKDESEKKFEGKDKKVEKVEAENKIKFLEWEEEIKKEKRKCEKLSNIVEELKAESSASGLKQEKIIEEEKTKLKNVEIELKTAMDNWEKTKAELKYSMKCLNIEENLKNKAIDEKNELLKINSLLLQEKHQMQEILENLTKSRENKEKNSELYLSETNVPELTKTKKDCEFIDENEHLRKTMSGMKNGYENFIGKICKTSERLLSSFNEMKVVSKECGGELKEKLKAFQAEQNAIKQRLEDVVLKYVHELHEGNSELLTEMNIMNQVLKERGETISKLEQLTENQRKEMEQLMGKLMNQAGKLQEKNKKLEELEDEMGKAKFEVETKHKVIREMEEELWRIKSCEVQGETLSSSTLSKAEESSRLAELEESFEERYSKLKIIAAKLKKKVSELQKQTEMERGKLLAAEKDYQSKITNFQNQIKSLRTIQTQYDTLQDLLDDEKKEKTSLKANLELSQRESSSLRKELEEVKAEKEKCKSEKNSYEKIKKELAAHIGELKQTLGKQKLENNCLEKEIQELKIIISNKDKLVEEEKEKYKKAMMSLEELKVDSKRHSLLELEMAAYEKTAEELKNRLDKKEEEIKNLESNLEREKGTRFEKEEEIKRLASTVAQGQLKANDFSDQVAQLNGKMNEFLGEIQKKSDAIKLLENKLEEKNNKIENLSLDLENLTKEKYKTEENLKKNEEKFCRQIHCLEEQLNSAIDVVSQRDTELEELKKEFQGYKVRAQSVLRQSQKETNPSRQQNALEELDQLRSTCESLKNRLEDLTKKIQKIKEENEIISEEKKRLFGRVQELNGCMSELREENESLKKTRQRENEEHAETLRIQKLQSDTLAQCFQKEMKNLEGAHSNQVNQLKKEIEKLQKNVQVRLKPVAKRDDAEKRDSSAIFLPVKPESDLLDLSLIEREECEGSESVEHESPRGEGSSELIPLEQLLSSSEHLEVSPTSKTNLDVGQLKVMLEKSENRIKHLTILLAEAESDSARINQLNEVLKEEIRRHQRSLEREKHAQNFEYLKNVFVKFVSLQNVDEKLRLIPVLNTILKLSPEEEIIVTNCAKGLNDQGSRAWGSYLHIWPST